MKREEHQKARELFENGYRYKYIMRQVPVSYRTLARWKAKEGWGNGEDRRKYNFQKLGNQNARGHGAPYGNQNAWKHGLYSASYQRLCAVSMELHRNNVGCLREYDRDLKAEKKHIIARANLIKAERGCNREKARSIAEYENRVEQNEKMKEIHEKVVYMVQHGMISYDTFTRFTEQYQKNNDLILMKLRFRKLFAMIEIIDKKLETNTI